MADPLTGPPTSPPRSPSTPGLSRRGLAVRLAAIVLLSLTYKVMPTVFSSAPSREESWFETLCVALVLALIIFGLTFLARDLEPGAGRRLNKTVTVVLAIPVIAVLLFLAVFMALGLSGMMR